MSLKKIWTGDLGGEVALHDPNYADIRNEMYRDFAKRRTVVVPDEFTGTAKFPDLSNGELVAMLMAWKRAAARSSQPSWPLWYDLTVGALGWTQPGDRFVMTAKHMKAPAPPSLIRLFWMSLDDLVVQIDSARTAQRPVIVDWSREGYEAAAREAWHQMQKETNDDARPLLPPEPTLPTEPPQPAHVGPAEDVTTPSESGGGLGWLLILAAIYLGTRKKGR